jgi:serine/threonine protein kinase
MVKTKNTTRERMGPDRDELMSRLSKCQCLSGVADMGVFVDAVMSAQQSLLENRGPDVPTAHAVIQSVPFAIEVNRLGGRPVIRVPLSPKPGDDAALTVYTGPFLNAGSYNRLKLARLGDDGEKGILRTTLRNPLSGSKSVLIYAVETAIHAILSGMDGIPRLYAPFSAARDYRTSVGIELGVVAEYVEGKDLMDVLAEDKDVTDEVAFTLFINIMQRLAYLWDRFGFQHRDLRGDNIRVRPDHTIAIIDLGFSSLELYGLDCNADVRMLKGKPPRAIDTMMLLWTLLEDCPNLSRDTPYFARYVRDLIAPHRAYVYDCCPGYDMLDKDAKWDVYQQECVYCAPDVESMWPENALTSARLALMELQRQAK